MIQNKEFLKIITFTAKRMTNLNPALQANLIANVITVEPKEVRNKIPQKKDEKEKNNNCWCYNKESPDSRCCGLCYCFCLLKDQEKQCHCCPKTFSEYWHSGYVQTTSGYGNPEKEENGICCWFCFLPKFAVFFPCCLGSLCNNSINAVRKTQTNYLF